MEERKNNKKSKLFLITAIIIVVVCIVAGLSFFFYKSYSDNLGRPTELPNVENLFGSTKKGEEITQLYLQYLDRNPSESEIAGWVMKDSDVGEVEEAIKNSDEYKNHVIAKNNCSQAKSGSLSKEKAFSNLNLLETEPNIDLIPDEGFMILNSVLSNSGSKIAYSEISKCVYLNNACYGLDDYQEERCNWNEDWKFAVYVKDLSTGIKTQVYHLDNSPKTSLLDKLKIQKAIAGGCTLVWYPLAWSKNDQKVILQWGNPTTCGSGGIPEYKTQAVNIDGTDLQPLATYDAVFYDNYGRVAYVYSSDKSPNMCGPVSQRNWGEIIIKDIESGQEAVLVEEPNSAYSNLKIDGFDKMLSYTVRRVKDVNGCSEEDSVVLPQEMKVAIP